LLLEPLNITRHRAIWLRREVLRLVQVAWRNGYYGLTALMAVAWDSQLSPVEIARWRLRRPAAIPPASTSNSRAPRPNVLRPDDDEVVARGAARLPSQTIQRRRAAGFDAVVLDEAAAR
jgi:hypothetical protein